MLYMYQARIQLLSLHAVMSLIHARLHNGDEAVCDGSVLRYH